MPNVAQAANGCCHMAASWAPSGAPSKWRTAAAGWMLFPSAKASKASRRTIARMHKLAWLSACQTTKLLGQMNRAGRTSMARLTVEKMER